MTPTQQRISDRLTGAVLDGLCEASEAELQHDHFDGMRIRPSVRAALGMLYPRSSPLRSPGPPGQLALLESA